MKTPRVTDFDPDAKTPIFKSSLDNMPAIEKRDVSIKKAPIVDQQPNTLMQKIQEASNVINTDKPQDIVIRDVRPVRPVLPVPPKRTMKQRWPVDIYQDQYESLQRLALEERMRGGIGSMSAMVREALDKLIKQKDELKK